MKKRNSEKVRKRKKCERERERELLVTIAAVTSPIIAGLILGQLRRERVKNIQIEIFTFETKLSNYFNDR